MVRLFNRLSPKGKRFILNGIIVLAIMLFIIGFLIGKSNETDKTNKETQQQEETENMVDGFSYSDLNNKGNQNSSNDEQNNENKPMHKAYEQENPEVDFNKNAEREVSVLEDYFNKKEIAKAKKVTKAFLKAYYPFNGDKPTKNIEKALKYSSEKLQEDITGKVVKPTYEFFKREITEIEVYEPYDPSGEQMELKARVKGKIFNSKGKLTEKEILEYDLKLISFKDTFKVDDYSYTTLNLGANENE